jgi:haloacid dehalogenase superfamily, subfamily IA, variant 1 with third motif having Dx(3-4)D or Dx(3-4)E
MKNRTIITLDLYGTLVDWKYTINSFLNFLGINPEDFFKQEIEEIKEYKPYSLVLKNVLKKIMGERYKEEYGEALIYYFAKSPPFPDTVLGLMKLKEKARLGIISNTEKRLIKITLTGIEEFFDWIVTAEDTGFYKPNKNAFLKAYEIMGLDPKEVIHVSSYLNYDLLPAEQIVKKTILLDRYGFEWKCKVNNLLEILKILE